ncbi:hypothetical protein LguiA_025598 [Lonicera macranthoides]
MSEIEWMQYPICVQIKNTSNDAKIKYEPRYYGISEVNGDVVWLSHWSFELWENFFKEAHQVEVSFHMNLVSTSTKVEGKIKECGIQILYFKEDEGLAKHLNTLHLSWDSGMDVFHYLNKQSHKRSLSCEYAKNFRNVIDRQDYHTIFTVFGVRNVASFLQDVPEDRRLETLNSYLLKATARIENPIRGSTTLLASLEQKVKELQARVTALEAQLEKGSSCVNPLCSFALLRSSSRFPLSAENNMPTVIPTAMNLPEPAPGSFLRLLMSAEEIALEIPPPIVNLIENGVFLTEVNLPSFKNPSYDQATLDSVYQAASEGFLSQSSLYDFVANFTETTGSNWTALENIRHDFSDYSSSYLSTILNFGADDFQILQPFLSD